MFQLLLDEVIRPLAFPLYCLIFYTLVLVFIGSIYLAVRDGITRLRQLHQIPCSRCAFFTGDYRLKCTVHPLTALSEEAINCRDFERWEASTTRRQSHFPTCSALCQERKKRKKSAGGEVFPIRERAIGQLPPVAKR